MRNFSKTPIVNCVVCDKKIDFFGTPRGKYKFKKRVKNDGKFVTNYYCGWNCWERR